MGTKILNDIHNDMKQLISAITSFEENEEGFRICERFCMSSIKHHRFLSVNSNTTKEAVAAMIKKFSIHGKYDVAEKFKELVDTFLSSFHPQYDLQWTLLTLLLDLCVDTNKSDLECLKFARGEYTLNVTRGKENDVTQEIDWGKYLTEGQDDFFCDYQSDSESEEWSEEIDEATADLNTNLQVSTDITDSDKIVPVASTQNALNKLSLVLANELESRNWLLTNVQNTWWNELEWQKYPVNSRFCDAHLCEIWQKTHEGDLHLLGTLSEYQACRELLWMFHVQSHMVVFQQNEQTNFSIHPRISIPSLTPVAFNSILLPFCEYFTMMYDIEQFGIDIYSKHHDLCQKPPLTYEAYNAAVQRELNTLKNKVLDIEMDIMKQDDSHTFLSVSALLNKHLNTIKILHEVHRTVITDWNVYPNWECASKLLSNLYFEIQKSHSQERTNICVRLYLSSFAVYLNIIDTWLSEGRFEDWREEFIFLR